MTGRNGRPVRRDDWRPILTSDLRLDTEPALPPDPDDPRLPFMRGRAAAIGRARLDLWGIFCAAARRMVFDAGDAARADYLARAASSFRRASRRVGGRVR